MMLKKYFILNLKSMDIIKWYIVAIFCESKNIFKKL